MEPCGGPDRVCHVAEARGEQNRCQGKCAYAVEIPDADDDILKRLRLFDTFGIMNQLDRMMLCDILGTAADEIELLRTDACRRCYRLPSQLGECTDEECIRRMGAK